MMNKKALLALGRSAEEKSPGAGFFPKIEKMEPVEKSRLENFYGAASGKDEMNFRRVM